MKIKLVLLLVLVLANVGVMLAQDCEKYCGCTYPYVPFTRDCGGLPTCYVSECVWVCGDCGYGDAHNDFCSDPMYGCFYS